ncbi:MAG: hypothetical protein RR307_05390 [Clostridia bacterium]
MMLNIKGGESLVVEKRGKKANLKVVVFLLMIYIIVVVLLGIVVKSEIAYGANEEVIENHWVCAKREGVFVNRTDNYAQKNRMFELLSGYYVKVVGKKGMYVKICINDGYDSKFSVIGYVLREDVNMINSIPQNQFYPKLKIKVKADLTFLYQNADDSSETIGLLSKGEESSFIGKIKVNEQWCYVRKGSQYGYVKMEKLENFELPSYKFEQTINDKETNQIKPKENIIVEPFALILAVTIASGSLMVWIKQRKSN